MSFVFWDDSKSSRGSCRSIHGDVIRPRAFAAADNILLEGHGQLDNVTPLEFQHARGGSRRLDDVGPREGALHRIVPSNTRTAVSRTEIGDEEVKYKVHRVDVSMTRDQVKLEQFLNSLKGEVVTIIPNVTLGVTAPHVDFLLVVERI